MSVEQNFLHPSSQGFTAMAGPYSEKETWMIDNVLRDLEAGGIAYFVHEEPRPSLKHPKHRTIYRARRGLQSMEETEALQAPSLDKLEEAQ